MPTACLMQFASQCSAETADLLLQVRPRADGHAAPARPRARRRLGQRRLQGVHARHDGRAVRVGKQDLLAARAQHALLHRGALYRVNET